jgi:hypothetical protein
MAYLKYLIFFLFILLPGKLSGSPVNIVLVFSGEELGNLAPCGCYEGQIGGISRRHTFINSITETKENNIIIPVSLGDLINGSGRQEEIKMEILCRAMDEMGYVLHNLGEKDIEIDPQVISYLSQTNTTAFLASNIKITAPFPIKTNQYILKEYVNSGYPLKIAFLGIISPSLLKDGSCDYTNIYDPKQVLGPLIKELQDKADLLVLLSHAPREESEEIANFLPEIDLIITGHDQDIDEPKNSITYVNNTPIVSAGKGGKYIGVAKYLINKGATKEKSIEVIPLDHTYKDSQEMFLLIKEYQQILKDEDLSRRIPQAFLSNELSYVGSTVCGTCHKTIYDHWSKTRHNSSYTTLVRDGYHYDPECIKCHTTGYGYVTGFLNYEEDLNLINVGCESCHGAGSGHIKNVSDKTYGLVEESTCGTCHDSQHSPRFQFNTFWKKIEHPEETLINTGG